MGSSAHWTLPYMTTFTLYMFIYNSVIECFTPKEPWVWLIGEQTYALSKILRYECRFNMNFSWDQGHIGHCRTWQLLLFICSATIVSLSVLLQKSLECDLLESKHMLSQRYKDMMFWRYKDTQIEHKCFMGSRAHWTLPYMTTSTLHMFSNNSVNDGFAPKEPQVWLYWIYITTYLRIYVFSYLHCFLGSGALATQDDQTNAVETC
jgi:hypothetical protein